MFREKGMKIDVVIELKADREALEKRIEGRRIHAASGRSYHLVHRPPNVAGVDDITGERLI